MAEVVVIGNAGVDTNVYLQGAAIDFSVEGNFTENTDGVGQAGGYASRGYARLGHATAFVGHTGDDAAGAMVRDVLRREGIDLSAVGVDPAGTARSVNIMFTDGSRKNFYDGKGHMTLQADLRAARRVLEGARLAHVNIPNWARNLLPLCRELDVTVACDLQDVVDPDDPYRRPFIAGANMLFFSAANHPDPRPIMERLFALGSASLIVAGMGKDGAALATRDAYIAQPPPPLDWPVVDSNGAGDSLAVGFLASHVIDGRPLEESLLRGQIAARWCCTQRGSDTVLISRTDLDRVARSYR
jgi:sugar/nucleoside kinase (ribokinase family)